MIFSLTACGGSGNFQENTSDINDSDATVTSAYETDTSSEEADTQSSDNASETSRILIAYFTWADNTVVEDPDSVDVDATTSASVLAPGNAAKIAAWIEERTGGDLFSIIVTEPYSSDYDECLDRAADEKAENARPQLASHVENMDQYDIVFLGFPNWWYTVPMAIHSFLEEYDFSGKTVIPFVTHGTGGLASTIQDIEADLPDSVEILEPIGIYRPDVDESQSEVNEWLDRLGFVETEISGETSSEEMAEEYGEKTVIMVVDEEEIVITLYDTPAANALYEMLPLELEFEDFNQTEKISYLTKELPAEGEPESCDPEEGDLCLYAPWGNLAIFYQDFGESDGLILLGHVESGMEILSEKDSDFSAVLRRAE